MKQVEYRAIRELNMDNIKDEEMIDYTDGDIAIADNIRQLPCYGNNTVKLNMVIIILCKEGKLQLDFNSQTYVLHPNDILFCHPNILLNNYMISPDFEGKIVGLSERIIQRLLHNGNDIWDKAFYISKNPIIHMEDDDLVRFNHYYELIKIKINHPPHLYHKEVIFSLLRAALYEICADLDKFVTASENNSPKQGDILLRKFIKLLEENGGKERSVGYYAKELCVTPKYLSYTCKSLSQKTALKWIHDYTTESIRYLLKHSDKSIKEVSDELNFPNISFFGKYVRTHFGMSPREVRKNF